MHGSAPGSARPQARSRRVRSGPSPPSRGHLRLRPATRADLGTLARHRRGMWAEIHHFTSKELDHHDALYRRWARRGMADGTFVAMVVENPHGHAVGSGALWLMPMQPRPGPLGRGRMPYILSMYTEPDYRGQGVATRIVRELVRWSRAQGYGRVTLHASSAGRGVYARLGFKPGSEMRRKLRPPSRGAR